MNLSFEASVFTEIIFGWFYWFQQQLSALYFKPNHLSFAFDITQFLFKTLARDLF